jgi:hypothetical protein
MKFEAADWPTQIDARSATPAAKSTLRPATLLYTHILLKSTYDQLQLS